MDKGSRQVRRGRNFEEEGDEEEEKGDDEDKEGKLRTKMTNLKYVQVGRRDTVGEDTFTADTLLYCAHTKRL